MTDALGAAMGSTLQLVTTAFVIGIIIGVTVGIATALRIYSSFDYVTTFIAFLFFSLPVFWVAVMLKQFAAINFNDFLADPVVPSLWVAVIALISGFVWMGIIGGIVEATTSDLRHRGGRRRRGVHLHEPDRLVQQPEARPGVHAGSGARRGRDRHGAVDRMGQQAGPLDGAQRRPGNRAECSISRCTSCSTSSRSSASARSSRW